MKSQESPRPDKMTGTIVWSPRSVSMEDRAAHLRRRIALYRNFLDDGTFPLQTEHYILRLLETEEELEQLGRRKVKLH